MPPFAFRTICSLMLFSMICYLFHHYIFVSASCLPPNLELGQLKKVLTRERIWDHYPIEGEIGL
jgi:hypothetical protein